MNARTTRMTGPLNCRARLLSAMFTAALMVPATALSQSPASVNLGSTANFAVLAGSLVSNIPSSAITGDIGLSPAAGSYVTGFGLLEVTGTVFTVDATGPAGSVTAASILTAAQGDLTIAYNNARDRMPVPVDSFLNPGSGNIGGSTLAPGLYKFTGAAEITGLDLTLTGGATDVWIFQIATDLNVGSGIQIILAGGAHAANIFWQVGTSATLGTTSVFKGTIMADQSISLNTGARLDGRALARIAAVTLASNAITSPGPASAIRNGSASQGFAFFQNHPKQSLDFTVPSNGRTTLKILNSLGQEVATLFNGEAMAGKINRAPCNGSGLATGLYFSKLEFNGKVRMNKMLLVR